MAYAMGIDLGTSSLKIIVLDPAGGVIALAARGYEYDSPLPGYAEQYPDVWYRAMLGCLDEIFGNGLKPEEISAVGLSGQMHGLVALDANGQLVRPAILHCDTRSTMQVRQMQETLGSQLIRDVIMNPAYTGFLTASLLWVREKERHLYERIRHVMLPKDYLFFMLTGEYASDYSDASATLAFDIKECSWSHAVLDRLGLDPGLFPECHNSYDAVGRISKTAALTGLPVGTPVVCGGGDAIMQSIGNGLVAPGSAIVNIGSSGQVFFPSLHPAVSDTLCTNTFCSYQRDLWFTMGAIMSAGLAYKWIFNMQQASSYRALDRRLKRIPVGSGGIIFLPYLNGERTPHVNPDLSGAFLGLRQEHTVDEMAHAVMEGVSFALYQCYQLCQEMNLSADSLIVSGGGSRSTLWLQMISDLFRRPVRVSTTVEQAATGAAICAWVGTGMFRDVKEACDSMVHFSDHVYSPNNHRYAAYTGYYEMYKKAYAANSELLETLTHMGRT